MVLSGTRPPTVGGPKPNQSRLSFLVFFVDGTIVVVGGATMQMLNSSRMIGMQPPSEVGVGVISSLLMRNSGSWRFEEGVMVVVGGERMHRFHSSRIRGMHPSGYESSTPLRFVEGPMVVVGGDTIHIRTISHTQPMQPGGAGLRASSDCETVGAAHVDTPRLTRAKGRL